MLRIAFALLALAASFPRPTPSPPTHPAIERASPPRTRYDANDLYSIRARRRIAHYLRLRLLELHAARFDRAEKAIKGELSIDDLLREP
jgi:hypothetical protein